MLAAEPERMGIRDSLNGNTAANAMRKTVLNRCTLEVAVVPQNNYPPAWSSEELEGAVNLPAKVQHKGYEYSVTSTGYAAFRDCHALTAVTIIPNLVTSIGEWAFYNCIGLKTVTSRIENVGAVSMEMEVFIGGPFPPASSRCLRAR